MCRHINEDKRRAEGHQTLFSIVNDIENCPVRHLAFVLLCILHLIHLNALSLLGLRHFTGSQYFLQDDIADEIILKAY